MTGGARVGQLSLLRHAGASTIAATRAANPNGMKMVMVSSSTRLGSATAGQFGKVSAGSAGTGSMTKP